MKPSFNMALPFVAALVFASCFKGENGPAGPAGENGIQGPRGLDGRDGVSVKTPHLTGMFRVFLKGTEIPFTKTDVDSSQYIFLSDTWTFRLFKIVGGSCLQANRGSVEWGGTTLVLTDSTDNPSSFITYDNNGGSTFHGTPTEPLLNCLMCDLRPSTACITAGK